MKRLVSIGLVVWLVTELMSVGHAEEIYTPEIIIQAKWGNGPGEFGIYTEAEPRGTPSDPIDSFRGPSALDVDKNGDIYIFDPVNWRVMVYDETSKYKSVINLEKDSKPGPYGFKGGRVGGYWWEYDFIKVDSKGNIYIAIDNGGSDGIRKFNKEGSLLKVYISKNDIEYAKKIWPKDKLEIVDVEIKDPMLMFPRRHLLLKLFPSEYYPITGYIDESPSLVISSNYNRSKKVVFFKFPKGWGMSDLPSRIRAKVLDSPKYKKEEKPAVVVVVNEDKGMERLAVIENKNAYYIHPWKEDIYANLYVMVWSRDSEKNVKNYIYKYNLNGNLVGTIERITPSNRDKPYPFISREGDIYQITYDFDKLEEGLKIIRWRTKSK